MARVTGLGGVFYVAKDPAATRKWYEEVLGLSGEYGPQLAWADEPHERPYSLISHFPDDEYIRPGTGGFMINLGGDHATLELEGRDALACYRAKTERGGVLTESDHHRYFCGRCGTHLYAWNSQWPALVHPVASAIDTPLPTPPAHVHMMLGSKAPWVEVEGKPDDARFDGYPERSLADWHADHGWSDAT